MNDPFDLARFVEAQADAYERALAELRKGKKRSHWMWFIFPQIAGLGFSAMSQRFAIRNRMEANAYLENPVLGQRLIACVEVLLNLEGLSASEIFGYPDEMKLRSSLTLFAEVSPPGSVFHRVLEKYFNGEPDPKTLRLLLL